MNKSRPARLTGALIAILALLLLGLGCTPPQPRPSAAARPGLHQVRTPLVEDLSLEQASSKLGRLGLNAEARYDNRTSDRSLHGVVYRQNPRPGHWLSRGSSVVLHIYRFHGDFNRLPTPMVLHWPRAKARKILIDAGLRPDFRWDRVTRDRSRHGYVHRQYPAPETEVTRGSKVVVYLFKYQPPKAGKAAVPNVMGRTLQQARKTLKRRGLRYRSRYEIKTTNRRMKNVVFRQTPNPGMKVKKGAAVMLYLYKYRVSPKRIYVPNLVGAHVSQAEAKARKIGLTPRVFIDRNAKHKHKRQRVYKQYPPPGVQVKPRTTLDLHVLR